MSKKESELLMNDVAHLPLLKDAQPQVYAAFKMWQSERRRGRPVKADKKIAVSAKIDPDVLAEMDARGLVRNAFINQTLRAALFGGA